MIEGVILSTKHPDTRQDIELSRVISPFGELVIEWPGSWKRFDFGDWNQGMIPLDLESCITPI